MNQLDYLGQTLDGKYQIERELGRGGMGTVYLATHLGTERPVAVKIIAPQFMQRAEFVERFRREARAAGRLRHPNVVNVTDFGFAESKDGRVAYLVMEYLDGCTLGEILDEERNLPVAWTLDILEQVCSAVQEAHEQGIIHRDLKPDNIWLEPNQRGGYTVKVLDFGIAKLEESHDADHTHSGVNHVGLSTYVATGRITFAGQQNEGTMVGDGSSTLISEASTIAQTADHGTKVEARGTVSIEPIDLENKTVISEQFDDEVVDQETIGTQMIVESADTDRSAEHHRTTGKSLLSAPNTADLTRVGAVLGTPLYMSPEQCRGEHLDPRSDIYSLGVIAYQMLSGKTPFSGDFKDVMESHKAIDPPMLKAKRVRRKMRKAVHAALDKNPENRPQTAEGFASVMRSRSEGLLGLLRRAMVIYSEHLPKFLFLTTLFLSPVILLTAAHIIMSFVSVSGIASETTSRVVIGIIMLVSTVAGAFCSTLTVGTIVWIVTQYLAVPLRPVRIRPALGEARRKWKKIAGSGAIAVAVPFLYSFVVAIAGFLVFWLFSYILLQALASDQSSVLGGLIGAAVGGLAGFFYGYVQCMLVAPVAMMETVGVFKAFRRSRELTRRSFMTAFGAAVIMFLIPIVLAGSLSFVVNVTVRAFDPKSRDPIVVTETDTSGNTGNVPVEVVTAEPKEPDVNITFGGNNRIKSEGEGMDMRTRVKHAALESAIQIFWLPLQIFVLSFSAIIVALLYLKTRLAGGESMNDLLERFEDDDRPRKKWQERVRQRLIQSGRIPSKS
ncbi:MAG: protein kinase [Pyrinomonadaceae bacterium]|nr:protein kinase [Pyrinomonadaceae bacterium]MBP6212022.1 protein kinase [Pyrinomonadaceae bacterium]